MKNYPAVTTEKKLLDVVKQIVKIRNTEDVGDFANLDKIFLLGRKTARQPSASNDVADTDRIGDFFPDGPDGYLYLCIDSDGSGTPGWVRIALGTW